MDDEHNNMQRVTFISLTLKTYGTGEHRDKSIDRLKKEIALQGFDANITVISRG